MSGRLVLGTLLAGLSACASVSDRQNLTVTLDPTVRLHTGGEGELGVSTDYGVVFLGRGLQNGLVEFTSWFEDGPSLEAGLIEPVGGGVFLTEAEILLPVVPISFTEPEPGTDVLVRGRKGSESYQFEARIARDDRVEGLLLRSSSSLRDLPDDQVGAGVYLSRDGVVTSWV